MEKEVERVQEFFKLLGLEDTIKVLSLLKETPGLTEIEITRSLFLNQSSVNTKLQKLRKAGLVKFKKNGRCVNYMENLEDSLETAKNTLLEFMGEKS